MRKSVKKLLTMFFPQEIGQTAQMFLQMKTKFNRAGDFIKSANTLAKMLQFEHPAYIQAAAALA